MLSRYTDGSPLSITNIVKLLLSVACGEKLEKFAKMKRICIVFLMFLGMAFMNELYAQKPITAMTETEINALSESEIKDGVIKDWGGILSLIMRGVKFDDRIVNSFAENFKEGALSWSGKEKYATVDYVIAEDLGQFYKMWYIGRNSCQTAVMEIYNRTYPTSIDKAMYSIMSATDVFYQKQQIGWLTETPSEYVDAETIINSMEP